MKAFAQGISQSRGRPLIGLAAIVLVGWGSLIGAAFARSSARDSTVSAFIMRRYSHGIRYEDAMALGPGAYGVLRKCLHDEVCKPNWSNAVVTMAIIHAPGTFETLREFLMSRFKGPVDWTTYMAATNVPDLIGITSSPDSAKTVDFLKQGAHPGYWEGLQWWYSSRTKAWLHLELSRQCIYGLGWSGLASARQALEELARTPPDTTLTFAIHSALGIHEKVARCGPARAVRGDCQDHGAGKLHP